MNFVLLFSVNVLKMVEGVKPLTHGHSLLPLDADLFRAERLEQDEENHGIKCSGVAPDWEQALAHEAVKIVLLHKEHVSRGVGTSEENSGLEGSLAVVKTVDDCLIALPLVLVHLISI